MQVADGGHLFTCQQNDWTLCVSINIHMTVLSIQGNNHNQRIQQGNILNGKFQRSNNAFDYSRRKVVPNC